MKIAVAFALSLSLHMGLFWQADNEPNPVHESSGSAGRTALAIAAMRFHVAARKADTAEVEEAEVINLPAKKPLAESVAAPVQRPLAVIDQAIAEPELPRHDSEVLAAPQANQREALVEPAVEQSVQGTFAANSEIEAQQLGFDQIPVMHEPRYKKAMAPDYPRLALKRGYQGVVWVRAKVGIDGAVQVVELLTSSGYQSLDSSAVTAVAQWQFHPYKVNEQLSIAWVEIPVEFTLSR